MKTVEAAARLLAQARQRSVPIADTYDIRPDPRDGAFAIAPIRVVGEELVQAVGYGHRRPTAADRRRTQCDVAADALPRAVRGGARRVSQAHGGLRIPAHLHCRTRRRLSLLTVMAYRYENAGPKPQPRSRATGPAPQILRLGYLLRLIKEIYHMPGPANRRRDAGENQAALRHRTDPSEGRTSRRAHHMAFRRRPARRRRRRTPTASRLSSRQPPC